MPIEYHIDTAKAIIYTRCFGDVTLAEVLDHFRVLVRDPDLPEHLDVLLDLSEQTSMPKTNQLRLVVDAIRRARASIDFGAVAVVACTNALYGMFRMFQVFTEDLFGEISVFRSVAEAQAWLAAHGQIHKA
jgi:hypothetical protein